MGLGGLHSSTKSVNCGSQQSLKVTFQLHTKLQARLVTTKEISHTKGNHVHANICIIITKFSFMQNLCYTCNCCKQCVNKIITVSLYPWKIGNLKNFNQDLDHFVALNVSRSLLQNYVSSGILMLFSQRKILKVQLEDENISITNIQR